MTRNQPFPGLVDRRDGRPGRRRAVDHDDGQAAAPRRGQLGGGCRAAGILGDEGLDAVFAQQTLFVFQRERAARGDEVALTGRSSGGGGSTLRTT